jgi:Tol biopolymer transport system component
MKYLPIVSFIFFVSIIQAQEYDSTGFNSKTLLYDGEARFLANVKQLTFEGENAEAYLSFDEQKIIFQSRNGATDCDQIYTMNLDGSGKTLVSTGKGRTTCSYFLPDGKTILYASTHLADSACPPPPSMANGYTWALYKGYDIFFANPDGGNPRQITATQGYDAEATVSPAGDKIIFTSVRDGDLELYEMNLDGSAPKRLTNHLGYDGGAFYSWNGKKIIFRASTPSSASEAESYKALLAEGLIRPSKMELFVMDSDGGNRKQLTKNGKANFAPFFHPDNRTVIFSSNLADAQSGRNFDLHLIDIENPEKIERVTFSPQFDGFPFFFHNGKKIIFSSNRNSKKQGDTNIFIADWIYKP